MNGFALEQLKNNYYWYLLTGLSLIIAGVLAIMYAGTSTLVSIIFLGGLFIMLGFTEALVAFKMSHWGSFFLHVALSILYIFGGIYMIYNPLINALSLTLLLSIVYAVSGIAKLLVAATQHVPHPVWLALNGGITLILGILIWQGWPVSGLWVIGTFIGIDMLFTGITLVMLSLKARKL